MQDMSDAARRSLAGHQVKVFVSGSTPDKEGHQMTRVLDLSMGGVNVWVENLQDCNLLEKTASAAVGRNWARTPLRLKKMKVGSVDVHVIGIDKRLPALVKNAFLGYEHFRS